MTMGLKILTVVLFISLTLAIRSRKPQERFATEVNILDQYANQRIKIANNALILTENGFLGEGAIAFTYAGRLTENDTPVAIKFIPNMSSSVAENEFAIFRQMNAYRNPQVETFGIPAVYYYGEWENFILIAMTKFDESLDDIHETKPIYPMDTMILLRNFVIQSRYMHAHGVCHGDPHSGNIMFRSHQSFLIDFGEGRMMTQENQSSETHVDWISFLSTILDVSDFGYISESWAEYKDELEHHIEDKGLARVVKEFGDEAFQTDNSGYYPNYDRLEELINEEITKKQGHGSRASPIFSWL